MGECHVHAGIRPDRLDADAARAPRRRGAGAPGVRLRGPAHPRDGRRATCDPEGLHIASTERMIQLVRERPGARVHHRHRDRHHAPHAEGGAGQAVPRGRSRGGVRLHEDDHAGEHARRAACSTGTTSPCRPTSRPGPRRRWTGWWRSGRRRRTQAGRLSACPTGVSRADLLDDAAALARRALAEDGARDVTSEVTVPLGQHGAGHPRGPARHGARGQWPTPRRWPRRAGSAPSSGVAVPEGDRMLAGRGGRHAWAGSLRDILLAERTMLNLLQRACGIATVTRALRRRGGATPAAASSTRGRRRRACACSTWRRCARAAAPCTGSTSRTP